MWPRAIATSLAACLVGVSGCGGGDPAGPAPLPSTVASVELSVSSLTLVRGADSLITGTVRMSAGTHVTQPIIAWASSDTTVARVIDGRVYGWGGGSTTVTASAGGKTARMPVTVTLPPRGEFQITWRFIGDVPASVRTAALDAADRLERIVVGDAPSVILSLPDFCGGIGEETIDDVVVTVRMREHESGAAATGGPCRLVDGRAAPAGGQIHVSPTTASLPRGLLANVVLHELGHVLGIGTGTRWPAMVVNTGQAPAFTGPRTVAVYRAIGFDGSSVPLDAHGNHWGGDALRFDLMSPIGVHFTRLSVAALADLGYVVNLEAAEPWLPGRAP